MTASSNSTPGATALARTRAMPSPRRCSQLRDSSFIRSGRKMMTNTATSVRMTATSATSLARKENCRMRK